MSTDPFESFPDLSLARPTRLTHKTSHEDVHDVRISLSGEIDMSNSHLIDAAVADALRPHTPRQVYVDLTDVGFLDSSGIHALLRCRELAVEAGCRFAVTNAQPMTHRVLELSGVLEALAVTPAAAAIRGLSAARSGWRRGGAH